MVTVYAVNEDQGEQGDEIIDLLRNRTTWSSIFSTHRPKPTGGWAKATGMAAVVVPAVSASIPTDAGASLLVIVDPARQDQAGIVTGLVQEALIKPIVYAEIERAISGLFKGKSVEGVDKNIFQTFINAGLKAVVAKSVNEAVDDPLIKIEPQPYSEQATQTEVNLLNSMVPGFALCLPSSWSPTWARRW